jgi:hypothetical protein
MSAETVIRRPTVEVFDYLSNYANAQESGTVFEVEKLTDGPIGVGTKWRLVERFLGNRWQWLVEVTAYEPEARVAFNGTYPGMRIALENTVAETSDGVHVARSMEARPSGFMVLLAPLMRPFAARSLQKDLDQLRDRLEQRD